MANKKSRLGLAERFVLPVNGGSSSGARQRTQLIHRDLGAYLWLTDRGKPRTIKF